MPKPQGRIRKRQDPPGAELQALQRDFAGRAQQAAGAERHQPGKIRPGQLTHGGGLLRDQRLGEPGGLLQLIGVRGKDTRTGREHGGKTAGHGKTLVMGAVRQQQAEAVRPALGRPGQPAVRIAGQDQMLALAKHLIGQFYCGQALRAVARAGEGDQQGRQVFSEVLRGRRDQLRAANGLHAAAQAAPQPGRQGLADKGRTARAGQHDPQIGPRQKRPQPVIQRAPASCHRPPGRAPQRGLPGNLPRRPVTVFRLEFGVVNEQVRAHLSISQTRLSQYFSLRFLCALNSRPPTFLESRA